MIERRADSQDSSFPRFLANVILSASAVSPFEQIQYCEESPDECAAFLDYEPESDGAPDPEEGFRDFLALLLNHWQVGPCHFLRLNAFYTTALKGDDVSAREIRNG